MLELLIVAALAAPGQAPPALEGVVLKVQRPLGKGETSEGTACPISPARADGKALVLTAAHCVGGVGSKALLFPRSGAAFPAAVVARDAGADVAWLLTDRAVDLPSLALAISAPAKGAPLRHFGLGGRVLRRGRSGACFGPTPFLELVATNGDSGGPVVSEETGEVLGAISTNRDPQRRDGLGRISPPADSTAGSCEAAWRIRPGAPDAPKTRPAAPERPRLAPGPQARPGKQG